MTDNGNNFDQESLLKSENMTLTGCLRMGQRRKFFYRCINNIVTYIILRIIILALDNGRIYFN